MLYFIIGIIIGILIGWKAREYKDDRAFDNLAEQGQLVLRSPEGWTGTDEAIDSIVKTAKR